VRRAHGEIRGRALASRGIRFIAVSAPGRDAVVTLVAVES